MIAKPVWCAKCKKHSWTRRQLLAAWERDKSLVCPEPSCAHEALPSTIEEALKREGILDLEEEEDIN